jgi:hypothetical protein
LGLRTERFAGFLRHYRRKDEIGERLLTLAAIFCGIPRRMRDLATVGSPLPQHTAAVAMIFECGYKSARRRSLIGNLNHRLLTRVIDLNLPYTR